MSPGLPGGWGRIDRLLGTGEPAPVGGALWVRAQRCLLLWGLTEGEGGGRSRLFLLQLLPGLAVGAPVTHACFAAVSPGGAVKLGGRVLRTGLGGNALPFSRGRDLSFSGSLASAWEARSWWRRLLALLEVGSERGGGAAGDGCVLGPV